MNSRKATFRLLRRGLIWLLILYWAGFVGYTIRNLAAGGPSAVVGWYMHINGDLVDWKWGRFLARQGAIIGLTVALLIFGRRKPIEHGK